MTDLLKDIIREKKMRLFNWPASADQALSKLKACFEGVSVLQHYNLEKLTWMKTDVSKFAIGEVLSQLSEEHANSKQIVWKLIAFFSHKMSVSETRY